MKGYTPGLQPRWEEEKKNKIIKLNTNENPFPPSKLVISALKNAIKKNRMHLYPDSSSLKLRQAIGQSYDLSEDCVLIGNGSDELLSILFRAVLASGDAIAQPYPSYSLYPIIAESLAAKSINVPLMKNWHINFQKLLEETKSRKSKVKIVVFANPNAPTGIAESIDEIISFIKANPVISFVDEAYAPFWKDSLASYIPKLQGLVVCGSFSKAFSLAGQRIGYLLAHPKIIKDLNKIRDSYNISYLAQEMALAAWQDKKEFQKRIKIICMRREALIRELDKLGFETLEAAANFIFTKPPKHMFTANTYGQILAKHRILIRHFPRPSRISNYVRISIGTASDMKKLIKCTKSLSRFKIGSF